MIKWMETTEGHEGVDALGCTKIVLADKGFQIRRFGLQGVQVGPTTLYRGTDVEFAKQLAEAKVRSA